MTLNPRVFTFFYDFKVRAYHSQGALNLDFGICFFLKKEKKETIVLPSSFSFIKAKNKKHLTW